MIDDIARGRKAPIRAWTGPVEKNSHRLAFLSSEAQNGLLYAGAWFIRRFYLRCVRNMVAQSRVGDARGTARPLSVIVPVAEKDAKPLVHCLAAANEMVRHPLMAKLVVGPDSARLRTLRTRRVGHSSPRMSCCHGPPAS